METKKSKLSLLQKLHEIQKSVDKFIFDSQSGTGNFGYQYVSGNQVLSIIRPLMNEMGLLLKQEVLEVENTPISYTITSYGKERLKEEMFTSASQLFTWICVDSGEREEVRFHGNGKNEWDKGLGSALTYAERYFLLKFFHVPTDKDDVDARNQQAEAGKVIEYTPRGVEKKELNIKAGNEITPEWTGMLQAIREGKINTIEEARKWFKISENLETKLKALMDETHIEEAPIDEEFEANKRKAIEILERAKESNAEANLKRKEETNQ